MTHSKQRQLIEMQASADKIFEQCRSSGKPFYDWPNWINTYIETSLAKFAEFKAGRLNSIVKRGQTKLLGKVEEKKNKESLLMPSQHK